MLECVPELHLFLKLRSVPLSVCPFCCPLSVDGHGSLPPPAVVNHAAVNILIQGSVGF